MKIFIYLFFLENTMILSRKLKNCNQKPYFREGVTIIKKILLRSRSSIKKLFYSGVGIGVIPKLPLLSSPDYYKSCLKVIEI